MPGHTTDISMHFLLLSSFTREIVQKQRDTERQFEEKQKLVESQYQALEEKQRVTEKQCQVLEEELTAIEEYYQEQLTATEEQVSLLKKEIHRMKIITGFPIDFKVSNKYEETLPPFFSHPHGYKMCISVDPRRYFRYRRTYVAVFAHLMRGPFDGHLKWPFRGMITIQIVNQAGDHSHVSKTFH